MIHTSETLRQAFKYFYPGELEFLKELAQSLPPNPYVINIGAGAGTSGLALLECRPDLYLTTVDIQKESSPFGCLDAELEVFNNAGYYQGRFVQRHQDSKEFAKDLNLVTGVNMVFIDGDHSYEGCKGDIKAWIPNIKSGGIIAVHDYKKGDLAPCEDCPHPKAWSGVDEAVRNYLLYNYQQINRVKSLIAFRI